MSATAAAIVARRHRWPAAIGAVLSAATLVGGGLMWHVHQSTPGGLEEWIGDEVSILRERFPVLVEPINTVQEHVHELSYRGERLLRSGGPVDAARGVEPVATPSLAEGASAISKVDAVLLPLSCTPSAVPALSDAGPAVTATSLTTGVPWQRHPEGPQWLQYAHVVANPDYDKPALALRIDLSLAELHWQPGTHSPWRFSADKERLDDVTPPPDRSGRIPATALGGPVLAFGGGFESIHFPHQGSLYQGRVITPMRKDFQTLVIRNSRRVQIGQWAEIAQADGDIREARQNLVPLVEDGKYAEEYRTFLTRGTFRLRENGGDAHTWRSAIGLTADGALIYVAGGRLTPRLLALAMVRLGVVEAMQLDINAAYHCAPTLFLPESPGRTRAVNLLSGPTGGTRFRTGSRKDFFYVSSSPATSVGPNVGDAR